MIIVIDENLPPSLALFLIELGYDARHWKDVGNIGDPDSLIFEYSFKHKAVILTQDLDFTRLLALRGATLPSLIQVRTECPIPSVIGNDIRMVLENYSEQIESGALITLDGSRHRIRLLPLK